MSRNPTANVYTLRAGSDDLLPLVTLLLYRAGDAPLDRTLVSILSQTDVDLEIILLQDGQAPSDVTRLLQEWPLAVPLYLLETAYPCGKARCVNLGLIHATGDTVLVLEAGDELAEDALGTMVEELDQSEPTVLGVYGNLEFWQPPRLGDALLTTLGGEMSNDRYWLLSLLEQQKRIAPPLVKTAKMRELGGYPIHYPSQGWLLADTAFVLSLLTSGQLNYLPDIHMRRNLSLTPDVWEDEDEQRILQLLLRQAAKRITPPPEFHPASLRQQALQKPLG